jgi:hypothetical protein
VVSAIEKSRKVVQLLANRSISALSLSCRDFLRVLMDGKVPIKCFFVESLIIVGNYRSMDAESEHHIGLSAVNPVEW